MFEILCMKKGDYIICPRCKGKGRVFDHTYGIFTLGFGYLSQIFDDEDREVCPRCDGSGFIEVG